MMRINERAVTVIAMIAVLAVPTLCVVVGRIAERHTGPSGANAATPSSTLPTIFAQVDQAPGSGYAAIAEASIQAGFGADPFERADSTTEPIAAAEQADDHADPTPEFQVTSVARGGDAVFAVVNGRLSRIGDEVTRGWRLVEIDTSSGVVRLRSDDGRTTSASLPRPEDRGNPPRQPGRP